MHRAIDTNKTGLVSLSTIAMRCICRSKTKLQQNEKKSVSSREIKYLRWCSWEWTTIIQHVMPCKSWENFQGNFRQSCVTKRSWETRYLVILEIHEDNSWIIFTRNITQREWTVKLHISLIYLKKYKHKWICNIRMFGDFLKDYLYSKIFKWE